MTQPNLDPIARHNGPMRPTYEDPNGYDEADICPACEKPIYYANEDDYEEVHMDENDDTYHLDCFDFDSEEARELNENT